VKDLYYCYSFTHSIRYYTHTLLKTTSHNTTHTPHTHTHTHTHTNTHKHTQVKLQLLGEGATPLWVTDLINSGMIVLHFISSFCSFFFPAYYSSCTSPFYTSFLLLTTLFQHCFQFSSACLNSSFSLAHIFNHFVYLFTSIPQGMLMEVHKFSKFIHGCAVLLPEEVRTRTVSLSSC
jgi:hypothetical protein